MSLGGPNRGTLSLSEDGDVRVLIADDHPVVRRGVRRLVEGHLGWEVCGEAADGQDALELARSRLPDVVVLDLEMPTLDGLGVARRLRDMAPSANVLLFTQHDDDETIHDALAAGVRGYVLKAEGAGHLEAAISALGTRRTYFGPTVTELLLGTAVNDLHGPRADSFTRREVEVTRLIADGRSNKEIARILQRSVKTVESHRTAAMRKSRARNSGELVRFAIKHHMLRA